MEAYEMVIGLEVHVELATKTKIFCGCTTQFGGAPNTHTCPICTGMPGTLPVANRKVIEFAVAAGLATNCEITRYNKFDRKNYFYPDLPKAYQISQLYLPICRNGHVDIVTAAGEKSVGIHEIHMEEDAGKLMHDPWLDQTMVDYNRCGVPLLEIVSEPDMRSAEEVIAYLTKLRQTLQYLGVSDCKMQEGSMRADVNLSVRPVGQKEFGTRTEMKNINSFKAIARAIAGEYRRQVELIEDGGKVQQQTRRWDDNKGASFAMRSKENAQDYRYFPEPDLPPISLSQAFIDAVRARQPELAEAKAARYQSEFGLPKYDAGILTEEKPIADLFEQAVAACGKPKEVSNWIMGETMAMMKEKSVPAENLALSGQALGAIVSAVSAGRLNRQSAREVFAYAFDGGEDIEGYIKAHGLEIVSDDSAYEQILSDVLARCEKDVAQYRAGNQKVFGFLVGQAMKALKGKADPKKINELLRKLLED
ncbi:MAG: Asp-tRNA(Asn)/Glu-tRNA(Gln) amidotransferase subunit GatB [Clostridiales bacterium]|nr:Asp-tRNA(Asn)/Glu-tRNA(Gln) amidotransferase subunit GatB [Clostridiales bacterium]